MSIDQEQQLERELATFYSDLDAVDLAPLWTVTEDLLTPTPRPKAIPWLWRASTYTPLAERAIRLVPVERGGERRVLSLRNPGLGGSPYAAGTLWGAVQCLGPLETAPAHRHSPGAIRFVIEGEGVFTTVNGDACDMGAGDLVLTPGMAWHDHCNTTEQNMFWFDGLDIPMVHALDSVFFEQHPELNQPVGEEHNQSESQYSTSDRRYTSDAVDGPLDPAPSPLLIYRWQDTDARLRQEAQGQPDLPSVAVEYTNPETGASVLPTLSCGMRRVFAGAHTPAVRRSGNTIYVVRHGRGHSVIDGRRFDWETGDMFVVPSWSATEHHAEEQSDLFALGDAPVLRALGLYREQTLSGAQDVTGVFDAH